MPAEVQCYEGDGVLSTLDLFCHSMRCDHRGEKETHVTLNYRLFWRMDEYLEKVAERQFYSINMVRVFETKKRYGLANPFPPAAGLSFRDAVLSDVQRGFSSISFLINHDIYGWAPHPPSDDDVPGWDYRFDEC